MAKNGLALMCLVAVLATFAQFALGSTQAPGQIGSIHFSNNAANMVAKLSTTVFSNGSSETDPNFTTLPRGQTSIEVMAGTDCVETSFEMADPSAPEPGARLHQVVYDWCITMPDSCLPDCYWTIDNKGFWVANSANAPLRFVLGWDSPDI